MGHASRDLSAKDAKSAPAESPAKAREQASAFVLIRLREGCDRVEAFRRLCAVAGVSSCDALHGEHDLVLLLTASSQRQIQKLLDERVRSSSDVLSVDALPISPPGPDLGVRASAALSAYLFLEVENGRSADILSRLRAMDPVVDCEATEGRYQIVARVQAASRCDLDRVLSHEIGLIDGILRTHTSKLIPMLES